MSETVVVLVNGEVLANGEGSRIADQRSNARELAESLLPLIHSDLRIVDYAWEQASSGLCALPL